MLDYFIVAYKNAFKIMPGLSMRCSASSMFANARAVKLVLKNVYSIMYRNESTNCIIKRIAAGDVYATSELNSAWFRAMGQ